MLYTVRHACSLANCGPTATMSRNDRNGTAPSFRYPSSNTALEYARKRW
ncbi:Uncharacterised protein [Mycobacteroides abscessus subsp. abscessus]|nr:Uncharacterised protein [Mycobacteroides abscessus subsp. abscessus]